MDTQFIERIKELASIDITKKALAIYDYLLKSKETAENLNLISARYIPGTITIAEKYSYFDHPSCANDFRKWIITLIYDFIHSINSADGIKDNDTQLISQFSENVIKILTFKNPRTNKSIIDIATIQQTTDIINRTVKIVLFSDQFHSIHINKEFNELGKSIVLDIVDSIFSLNLKDQIRFSVVSGTIGYEIKNSYKSCIPSALVTERVINIFNGKTKLSNSSILQKIIEKLDVDFTIDQIDQFLMDVSKSGTELVFFTDDYIESIFDLVIISNLLKHNPNLKVTLIPRNGQYANDFSFIDAMDIIENDRFKYLRNNIGKRFSIIDSGPRGSGISITELSNEVLKVVERCSLILFKGARVFEMVSGVNKKCYFAFNIIHEQSSALTGVSAKEAPSIFVGQDPSKVLFHFKSPEDIVTTIDIMKYGRH